MLDLRRGLFLILIKSRKIPLKRLIVHLETVIFAVLISTFQIFLLRTPIIRGLTRIAMVKVSNFSFVQESFVRATPVIHYEAPGSNEERQIKIIEGFVAAVWSSQYFSTQGNPIPNGSEIWLSVDTGISTPRTASEHFIYNSTSPYRVGYGQGKRKTGDLALHPVAFSDDINNLAYVMEPYCGQNDKKFIDELESVSGDSGSKNLADVTRIGFSPTDRSLLCLQSWSTRIVFQYLAELRMITCSLTIS